jgi:chloride channel 7
MIVVGSAYGRMVGLLVRLMFPSADPGIYAIMGAAAFMAGVSRLTVSLTVILIEITNDLANLLPLMLVVMTAKWVADPIIHPFFDKLIEMKHIPYLEPNPTKEMKLLQCRHIMARKPKYFKEKEKIGKILLILKDCTHNGFPIVNDDKNRRVKGLILRTQLVVLLDRLSQIWVDKTDLEYSHQNYQTRLAWTLPPFNEIFNRFDPQEDYNREIDLTPFINLTVVSVNTEFAVSEAYTIFRTMGLRHLPVVDENNKLKGMITKKDLLEHNCKEIYLLLKRIKETDINKDMVTDDDSPLTSPRVLSPAASRRPSPTHSRVASRRTSPSVSRRNSFTNLRGSGPHARSPPIPVAIQDAHK